MIDKPILITGCARSGTSMTAGIIDICGGFGGELCGPTRFNPRGQFENLPIVQGITKPFLKSINCDPMGQKPLPRSKDVSTFSTDLLFVTEWNEKITHVIKSQGFGSQNPKTPWFYKGAKLCLIWQIWAEAFPDAKWIITHRRHELIIDSCMNTVFMRRYTNREGWQRWIDAHWRKFDEMVDAGLDIRFVNTEFLVKRYYTEMIDVIEHLGLQWNQKKVNKFISPEIWNTVK